MTESTVIGAFMSGAIALAFGMIAVCFVRFWRQSRLRLLLFFAVAFFLLTLERIVLVVANPDNEFAPYVYSIRLVAFMFIIIAIFDQNRTRNDGVS